MQPIKYLSQWLSENANGKHYLFTLHDLRALFTELTDTAFKTLLSRAVASKLLVRLCRGLYLYQKALPRDGLLLFHAAAILRADEFNYISLETALSAAGVISQIPMNWITIMSSGRSNSISCGDFGTIEFIHTNQKPKSLVNQLIYDEQCGIWRAKIKLALRDMRATHRNCDLIDWSIANELI
jgi:predicted transcriptional regulator of viral defense system